MKLTYMPVDALVPYDNNPRRHPEEQIKALMAAIQEFGFDQPVVVTSSNVVIKGHGRLEAAKRLGMKEVPVVVKAISDTDAKLLRVLDNEVVSDDWDYHALDMEIDSLQTAGFNTDLTGFTKDDLEDLPDTTSQIILADSREPSLSAPSRTCNHCGYKF